VYRKYRARRWPLWLDWFEEEIFMSPKLLSSVLSKTQLLEFLELPAGGNWKKQQLVDQLLQRIEQDAQAKMHLLAKFPYELAVEPVELEELLGCSKAERRRWVEEGKLPVLEFRQFRKGGRDLLYAVHDRRAILALTQEEVASWREAHRQRVKEHREASIQAALEKKRINREKRNAFLAIWQQTVEEWQQQGIPELTALLELAYWTVWASRWAKQNHVKYLTARKYRDVYAERRDRWYERKNRAMLLFTHTPYARLSFYRPQDPDKHRIWLCDEHYELKCEDLYENVWDFYACNTSEIEQCPMCVVEDEKDYYSLYHIEIATSELPDVLFSFHMPYPLGKQWFPPPEKLPSVIHVEQDGLFRFGRPLMAGERITHRERDVEVRFEQALEQVKHLFALEKEAELALPGQQSKSTNERETLLL
jgi:hypothetical protein